jgi:DNA-binding MarR family transcriptional regulator
MDPTLVHKQARTLASLLPTLMRQFMAVDEDPAAELPLAQLKVCNLLFHKPQPMSELSRELGVSLSAMTQIANRLERADLVKRVAKNDDRRVRCLELTNHGSEMMQLREDARIARASVVLEHLSPKAREQVLAAFEGLIRACVATREYSDIAAKRNPSFTVSKVLL